MTTPDVMPSAGEQRASLNLAAPRRAAGLTLEEIACATSIGLRYLDAIEAEDFARLPSGVYAVS
jgi:cytoskeleton protein RodZ